MAGDRYLVAAPGQGDWAGQAQSIAIFEGAGWRFAAPQTGWRAYVLQDGIEVIFDGSTWVQEALETVSPDAVLLNHAGAGHQLKVNKAAGGHREPAVSGQVFGEGQCRWRGLERCAGRGCGDRGACGLCPRRVARTGHALRGGLQAVLPLAAGDQVTCRTGAGTTDLTLRQDDTVLSGWKIA